MFKIATVTILALALSGCGLMTAEQRVAADDSYCRGIGAQPGTPIYVECRLRRDEQRQARIRAALSDGPTTCSRFGNSVQCF
jgi:hypothetical protein